MDRLKIKIGTMTAFGLGLLLTATGCQNMTNRRIPPEPPYGSTSPGVGLSSDSAGLGGAAYGDPYAPGGAMSSPGAAAAAPYSGGSNPYGGYPAPDSGRTGSADLGDSLVPPSLEAYPSESSMGSEPSYNMEGPAGGAAPL